MGVADLPVKGVLYQLVSCFLYAASGIFIKKISTMGMLEIACLRVTFEYIWVLPLTAYRHDSKAMTPTHNSRLMGKLLLRSIFGLANLLATLQCLQYLSIGDASTLMISGAIIAVFLSRFIFHERIDWIDGGILALTVVGCAFVAQPKMLIAYMTGNLVEQSESVQNLLKGIGYGVITAFTSAAIALTLRSMPKDQVNSEVVTFYYVAISTMLSWPLVLNKGTFEFGSTADLSAVFIIGVFGYIAKTTKSLAYQNSSIFTAQVVGSSRILFSFIFDVTIFDASPSASSTAGAIIVMVAVVMVGYRKYEKSIRKMVPREPVQSNYATFKYSTLQEEDDDHGVNGYVDILTSSDKYRKHTDLLS